MSVIVGIITIAVLFTSCQFSLSPPDNLVIAEEVQSDNSDGSETFFVGEPLPDDEVTHLMQDLAFGSPFEREAALEIVVNAKDERFIAVFIELLRALQIGIVPADDAYIEALASLSGQPFGYQWDEWIEWYGATDLTPPPGFTTWKGRLLSVIDPGFAEFLNNDHPSDIRVEEIQWGGVRVDGIPALDHAPMIQAADADYLLGEEPVFGIEINGDARAYPLRILDWHEMANDTIDDVPVSLAYCTLCGAAIAYDGRASDGVVYDFGSSGFLFRSNKLMYDRQTRTLWNQLTGKPVLGPLVGQDVKLDLLPVVLTTWDAWQAQHPNTLLLDINTGFSRPYELGSAYGHYFSADDTMFPVWQRSEQLETKEHVYALLIDDVPVAYPVKRVAEEQVINDTVLGHTTDQQASEREVVVVGQRGLVSANGTSRRIGAVTYTAGSEIRVYERQGQIFKPGREPDTILDENGQVWMMQEDALVGPDGTRLPRINGHLAYWFGWYAFYPQTVVYGSEDIRQ
ncbi:DUF3179 domain-containing protein [Chloroflexi bacterium TSY]|nr:DUF3179 domain-containing protein [Chloroflexi bacterium TSY]